MIAAQLVDCFIICSFLGWIYECTYCTLKGGHWQNRGFLYGPICPIYGSGVVLALVVFECLAPGLTQATYSLPQIFLICAAGSAVLEFATSWVLERMFHALWWDYSSVPFNIQGRICLPATCGFGIAGILVVRFLIPFMTSLPLNDHPIVNELLCIVFTFLGGMDLALTVASLTRILERMESVEAHFNEHMETGYQTFQQGPAAIGSAAVAATRSVTETAAIAAMLASDTAREHVESVTETAAIAAMLATDSARDRMSDLTAPAAARARAASDAAREHIEDVTETAAIAAMLATDSAREQAERSSQEMAERVRLVMQSLSGRERYHLRSIRTYRPVPRKGQGPDTSERLRRLFASLQDKAQERQRGRR